MQCFVSRVQQQAPCEPSHSALSACLCLQLTHPHPRCPFWLILIWRWERNPLSSFLLPPFIAENGHTQAATLTTSYQTAIAAQRDAHALSLRLSFCPFCFLSLLHFHLNFISKMYFLNFSFSVILLAHGFAVSSITYLDLHVRTTPLSFLLLLFLFFAKNVPMICNTTLCNAVLRSYSTQTSNLHHPKGWDCQTGQ